MGGAETTRAPVGRTLTDARRATLGVAAGELGATEAAAEEDAEGETLDPEGRERDIPRKRV